MKARIRKWLGIDELLKIVLIEDRCSIMIDFPDGSAKSYHSTRIPAVGEQITVFQTGDKPALHCTVERIVTMLQDHSREEFQVRIYVRYGKPNG